MLFDPNESIQLQGFTGPFVQYTHARIRAILRKGKSVGLEGASSEWRKLTGLESAERQVIQVLGIFENKVKEAARDYSPAVIANYVYELAKAYNQFYQSIPVFSEADQTKLHFRIALSAAVASVIKKAMGLLGIRVPEKM
jgi:arginyl-tRNA synthetase